MASVTLTTLRARVRERADMATSQFITDTATSLDAWINGSLDELYDLIIQKFGDDYYVSFTALTTVAGTSTYALPSDFYKLLGVELPLGGEMVTLEQFEFRERNAFRASFNLGLLPRYRLNGSNLMLYPVPNSVMAGTLWYTPTRTQLVAGSDAVNYPGGWEEYAVIDAAIKARVKEETDIQDLQLAKAEIRDRINSAAQRRNASEPSHTTDVNGTSGTPYERGY